MTASTARAARTPAIWLWVSGRDLDGGYRTDATWLHDATKVLHVTGHATRWARMRHWKRSAIRQALVILVPVTAWDWWHHPVLTPAVLSLLTAITLGHYTWKGARRFLPLRHYWQWVRPFRHTLQAELGLVPTAIAVDPARTKVLVGLPHEFLGSDHERAAITKAVTEKLAIEAPDASWRLQGRSHEVAFIQADPPPSYLTCDDIWPDVLAAKYDELLGGIGHRAAIIKASLESDSPMFGEGMGTGGGKTNLAAFWGLQRLVRGDIVYYVDGKRFSHPYAFKDMDAERDQLPNVGYVRRIDDIHRGLVRLGRELADRNERAEHVINARGHMLGGVGPRLWVVLEELNMVVPMLKLYWTRERGKDDPKQSPALLALSALSFAGRQVGIHLIFIGQRLDADVLGTTGGQGGAVRGNIGVRALARYDEKSWKLQAGSIPMPPSPSVPGRIQMWIGGEVHETQVPHMDYEQVRELAVSGTVTPFPADWPGAPQDGRLALPAVPVLDTINGHAPFDQPLSYRTPERPPGLVTIREAVDQGVFGRCELETARKRVQRAIERERLRAIEHEGKAALFQRADLYAMQREKELVR